MTCAFCSEPLGSDAEVLREEGYRDLWMCADEIACFFRMDITIVDADGVLA
jgi:hypothetical protein